MPPKPLSEQAKAKAAANERAKTADKRNLIRQIERMVPELNNGNHDLSRAELLHAVVEFVEQLVRANEVMEQMLRDQQQQQLQQQREDEDADDEDDGEDDDEDEEEEEDEGA